eukprot:TRINITY_DN1849_c0_g1_i1.p1 TRINITY_DN1849_c0_g1~~TRINITY_DN1849_c0_g1_i1.p1  ORF type:complete len:499 (-),score=98.80 TRINITY_DN1849_c0_g1_i1:40-1536(-)
MAMRAIVLYGRTASLLVAMFIGFFIGVQFTSNFPHPSLPNPVQPFAHPTQQQQHRKAVDPSSISSDILMNTFESLQALADETRRKRSEDSTPSSYLSNLVEQLCEKVDVVTQLLDQLNCTKPKQQTSSESYDTNADSIHHDNKNQITENKKEEKISIIQETSDNNNLNNILNYENKQSPPPEPFDQRGIDASRRNNVVNNPTRQPTQPTEPKFNDHVILGLGLRPVTQQPLEPTLHVDLNYKEGLPFKKVVVVVSTSPSYSDRRAGIRATWVNYLKGTPYEDIFVYKFFLGLIEDPELKAKVEEEQATYGDIVILDSFVDSYKNLSYKTLGMMRWAVDNYDLTCVLKLDDDTFLRLDKLAQFIQKIPSEKYFVGHSFGTYKPNRDPNSQWYVSEAEYAPKGPGPTLLAGGAGYLMTKDCAYALGHRLDDPTYQPMFIEDVNTAMILREYGVKGLGSPLFYAFATCTEIRMTFHYMTPERMSILYNNSREKAKMCPSAV